ncbi:MAG: deoxyribodipyrimidine photo-lyase [Desulfotignum sp.]|nr:deoxyribodipyrimidine photo-lyase [Desulfotignum sp.]
MTIHPARIRHLNRTRIQKPAPNGEYVLYWMQQSQRAAFNHALEFAVDQANQLGLPLVTGFGLTDAYPDANLRHYTFMLEGLAETRTELADRGIQLVIQKGNPPDVALDLGRQAALIVCDAGYLRHQRQWRNLVAQKARCPVFLVETDVVVPVAAATTKAEYAARTIRPRIHRVLADFLMPLPSEDLKNPSLNLSFDSLDSTNPESLLNTLSLDTSVPPVTRFFPGGASQAQKRFQAFVETGLENYDQHSNQPQTDDISHMSPYLHFGQISPLYLALAVMNVDKSLADARDAFIEQLIIRRELAVNFVYYTPNYDAFDVIPGWAQNTLADHEADSRQYIYSQKELADAATHDPYWNAAMREMTCTGFMHNYMRMYWGKKILEWSPSPKQAFETTLALNNRYFLDGRDPNSYTGVAWLYGIHDRGWAERSIFGKVRYMAASGLERKCDIHAYVEKIEQRCAVVKS